MSRRSDRVSEAIGLAAAEGLGIAAIGLLGAEAMLAPAGASLSVIEGLTPGVVAGIAAGLYRFSQYVPIAEPVGQPETPRVTQSAVVGSGGLVLSAGHTRSFADSGSNR